MTDFVTGTLITEPFLDALNTNFAALNSAIQDAAFSIYADRAALQAADVDPTNGRVYLKFFDSTQPADGGAAWYDRMASAPVTEQPWQVRSNDGAWWELSEDGQKITPAMYGYPGNSFSLTVNDPWERIMREAPSDDDVTIDLAGGTVGAPVAYRHNTDQITTINRKGKMTIRGPLVNGGVTVLLDIAFYIQAVSWFRLWHIDFDRQNPATSDTIIVNKDFIQGQAGFVDLKNVGVVNAYGATRLFIGRGTCSLQHAAADPVGLDTNISISAITQANPAKVTTSTPHGYTTGDYIYVNNVVGMTQVNDTYYTITVLDTTNFTLGVDSSGYSAYVSDGDTYKPIGRNIDVDCTLSTASNIIDMETSAALEIRGRAKVQGDNLHFNINYMPGTACNQAVAIKTGEAYIRAVSVTGPGAPGTRAVTHGFWFSRGVSMTFIAENVDAGRFCGSKNVLNGLTVRQGTIGGLNANEDGTGTGHLVFEDCEVGVWGDVALANVRISEVTFINCDRNFRSNGDANDAYFKGVGTMDQNYGYINYTADQDETWLWLDHGSFIDDTATLTADRSITLTNEQKWATHVRYVRTGTGVFNRLIKSGNGQTIATMPANTWIELFKKNVNNAAADWVVFATGTI